MRVGILWGIQSGRLWSESKGMNGTVRGSERKRSPTLSWVTDGERDAIGRRRAKRREAGERREREVGGRAQPVSDVGGCSSPDWLARLGS